MRGKKENENSSFGSLHGSVLEIALDGTRRWTGAVWKNPEEIAALRDQIRRLVVGTVLAKVSTPATEREVREQRFDSFDLLFFEAPSSALSQGLRGEGWAPIDVGQLTAAQEERLTVFQNEARRQELDVPESPAAIFRLGVRGGAGPVEDRARQAASRVGDRLGEQLWGETPGLLSKGLYDELRGEVQLAISPDEAGLAILEDFLVEQAPGELWVPHPVVFQALCDFIGVVLQARGDREVQWAPSVVDKDTGLAKAPLLRIRRRQGPWRFLTVGRDVVERVVVPWAAAVDGERRLVSLVKEYVRT